MLQILFEGIQKRRPLAADLLSLTSFFDRLGISDSLLQEGQATICHSPNDNEERSNTSDVEDDTNTFSEINKFEEDLLVRGPGQMFRWTQFFSMAPPQRLFLSRDLAQCDGLLRRKYTSVLFTRPPLLCLGIVGSTPTWRKGSRSGQTERKCTQIPRLADHKVRYWRSNWSTGK